LAEEHTHTQKVAELKRQQEREAKQLAQEQEEEQRR